MRSFDISNKGPEKFVGCRVGIECKRYQENLTSVIDLVIAPHTGTGFEEEKRAADFIVTPIAPPQSRYFDHNRELDEIDLIPDLVIPAKQWEEHVAVSIDNLKLLDKLIEHAMYLPTPVIIIDCPECQDERLSVASTVNRILRNNSTERLILFRLPLDAESVSTSPRRQSRSPQQPKGSRVNKNQTRSQTNVQLSDYLTDDSGLSSSSNSSSDVVQSDWNRWNNLRSLLAPDHRIGLCLVIRNVLDTLTKQVARWTGEPVRMITLDVSVFSSKPNFPTTLGPAGCIREFMRTIALANSLRTSFVLETNDDIDISHHTKSLAEFCDTLSQHHIDDLRAWNDELLKPLQPLSSNLNSTTYQIFEHDTAKYFNYHLAMVRALKNLRENSKSTGRNKFVVMILGAGRGPLVDAMIKAIAQTNLKRSTFKIFALDKNFSSIRSLRYKQKMNWNRLAPSIQVEIVEADMRSWEPSDKADIIATELLGSFSDNELSPECIDGTWRFATPSTICIPQSYSSYIAPICSYRMAQELYKTRFFTDKSNSYDELQVVRLTNYYEISKAQELFKFDHSDISKRPIEGANQREVTLSFKSEVDTVCHGFAGYFSAKLYGNVEISTVPENKTPTMESWFSAFIPLAKPIQMPSNTCMEVKFYRKESYDKVWYEWSVIKPETSRIHSLDGNGTAMSKLI